MARLTITISFENRFFPSLKIVSGPWSNVGTVMSSDSPNIDGFRLQRLLNMMAKSRHALAIIHLNSWYIEILT